MKILFLYDCLYPDTLGGVEHRNDCLARKLADRGHEVTLAGWFRDAPPPHPGLRFLRLPGRAPLHDANGKRRTSAAIRFALACLTLDLSPYDIIETANIPYLHLFPLRIKTRRAGKPLFVTWYEYFGPLWTAYKGGPLAAVFRGIEALAAQIGDKLGAISPLTQKRVEQTRHLFRRQTPVALTPCGADLAPLNQAAQTPEPSPPLIYAGRLIPEKRVHLLIEALSYLPPDLPTPLAAIIGEGPERAALERRAAALGLQEKVIFLGKLPTIADVWRQVAGARIAVQPSAREGFGLFPLEAMALARPVLFCESPDNAIDGLVRDGIDGIRTAPTPQAVAAALLPLLKDNSLWTRLSHAAQARAQDFDWTKLAKDMEALFYKATQKTPSPSHPAQTPPESP